MSRCYKILIVDDEPLVQIGLKTMIDRDMPAFEIAGTASNGRDAFRLIGELSPDIVISDIKMPLMSGLELLESSRKDYGPVPVFIMLTAYEDFKMARRALSSEAVDYLVKIELSTDNLRVALDRATHRIQEHSGSQSDEKSQDGKSIDEFRQRFAIKLLNNILNDRETVMTQATENKFDLSYNRYIVVYGTLCDTSGIKEDKLLTLYTSALEMTQDILQKYARCYGIANDMRHFTFIFFFNEDMAVADMMKEINDGVENAIEMISSYFSVALRFGIGTAVSDPMSIHTSFEEARTAQEHTDASAPVRLFSHVAGANRRSGKDKLISSIQQYIDDNLDSRLQLTEVAEYFGLSGAYLSTIFKKNTEVGFSEYIYTKKIEKAKQMLLNDDMKIYEVADALGFESAYYFSKVFKKVEGISPREWLNTKLKE